MRKMLLILAFAMVAVAGRSQRYYWEDSVYMAYADTLNQVYTGPLKMHAQYVLRMLDGKISCMERYE